MFPTSNMFRRRKGNREDQFCCSHLAIGVYVSALSVVSPVSTVAVKSRVDGQPVKVNYQEGQPVQAGDRLVEIDAAPFQAALAQAEGQNTAC